MNDTAIIVPSLLAAVFKFGGGRGLFVAAGLEGDSNGVLALFDGI